MTHALDNWKPYLNEEDFEYLINYVENSKNNLPNNKFLILLGNGIQYGQSIIADTNNIEKINKNLLDCVRIIKMEHKFV